MLHGMTGVGSFSQSEMRIAMAFATGKHERIANYHNAEGVRTKGGIKIRHFLYINNADVKAMIRVVAETLGVDIVSGRAS